MENKIVLADTSILIEFFRKTDKSKSQLIGLVREGYYICISAITEYEIYSGASDQQLEYWDTFLNKTRVIPFDKDVAKTAVDINNQLKRERKQIGIADLFIAASALANHLPFATLNKKHFDRINYLNIVDITHTD